MVCKSTLAIRIELTVNYSLSFSIKISAKVGSSRSAYIISSPQTVADPPSEIARVLSRVGPAILCTNSCKVQHPSTSQSRFPPEFNYSRAQWRALKYDPGKWPEEEGEGQHIATKRYGNLQRKKTCHGSASTRTEYANTGEYWSVMSSWILADYA